MIYSSGFFDKVGIRQSLDPVTKHKIFRTYLLLSYYQYSLEFVSESDLVLGGHRLGSLERRSFSIYLFFSLPRWTLIRYCFP